MQPLALEGPPLSLASSDSVIASGGFASRVDLFRLSSPNAVHTHAFFDDDLSATVRAVSIDGSMDALLVGLSDGVVVTSDVPTLSSTSRITLPAPASAVYYRSKAQLRIAGDAEGGVHLLDSRNNSEKPVISSASQGDYISGLFVARGSEQVVLAASGDGTLAAYDMRSMRLAAISSSFDDDISSLAAVEGQDCVMAGTLRGALHIYSAAQVVASAAGEGSGEVELCRSMGHPDSVNAIVIRDELALTGCADGLVRAVEAKSGKLEGVLPHERSWAHAGEQKVQVERPGRAGVRKKKRRTVWPIETMVRVQDSNGKDFLAIGGHEDCIRFCDLCVLDESDEEVEENQGEKDAEDADVRRKKPSGRGRLKKEFAQARRTQRGAETRSFFNDL